MTATKRAKSRIKTKEQCAAADRKRKKILAIRAKRKSNV